MLDARIDLKPLRLFESAPGGATQPALLAICVNGERVNAEEWFQGATGEHRDFPHDELRRYFSVVAAPDGGLPCLAASADFSHLPEGQMCDLFANLVLALHAAARNPERVVKANDRLSRSLPSD